jgi:hypothetical protein
MNIQRALKNNRLCKALTGMTPSEINNLLITFDEILLILSKSKKRIRKAGGGRKGVLKSNIHKLFYILFYLKIYPTFDLAGFIFDVDRSKTHRWTKKLFPILEKTLGRNLVLPKRKITTTEELFEHFPEAKEIFIDGTERRIQRSKNDQKQKKNYSGKKKCHTRKNIIICNKEKEILYLSPTTNGKRHDFNITKNEGLPQSISSDINTYLDTGFQGIKKLVKNPDQILMPKKKTKNIKLTPDEKETNSIISSIRIKVEHAIGGIKRFNCLSHIYRNRKGQDDKFIYLTTGLWNYHLRMGL